MDDFASTKSEGIVFLFRVKVEREHVTIATLHLMKVYSNWCPHYLFPLVGG